MWDFYSEIQTTAITLKVYQKIIKFKMHVKRLEIRDNYTKANSVDIKKLTFSFSAGKLIKTTYSICLFLCIEL